jgi:hypothetical protein
VRTKQESHVNFLWFTSGDLLNFFSPIQLTFTQTLLGLEITVKKEYQPSIVLIAVTF